MLSRAKENFLSRIIKSFEYSDLSLRFLIFEIPTIYSMTSSRTWSLISHTKVFALRKLSITSKVVKHCVLDFFQFFSRLFAFLADHTVVKYNFNFQKYFFKCHSFA